MTTHPAGDGAGHARARSALDDVANAFVQRSAALDPFGATALGIPGHDHLVTDYSPAAVDARAELSRTTLDEISRTSPVDAVDEVTLAAMRERLGLDLELHAAGEVHSSLNVIASPLQGMRDVLDIAPQGTSEHWEAIAARLSALPQAIEGYVESLRWSAGRGRVAALLQVTECAAQADELADPATSFFTEFVHGPAAAAALDDSSACAAVRKELEHGARAASEAYGTLARFLREELAPLAPLDDAVGRDRYALASRYFLGATVDLDETYEWGLEELARVVEEQTAVAAQVAGRGATVAEAVERLDADPSRTLHGTEELRRWMQETSDDAVRSLNGVHFDIPDPVLDLECRIAPTQTGGIYYTPPSDDFSRPGRMWWSVPAEVTEFSTWREKTTVFHEGVPGHHLQAGQAVHERGTLNDWRRLACWVSGHGEGWALYAERLMADLGYLDDPGDRLGMLDAQRMRAARVVLDIGVHLRKPAPADLGGGVWDAAKAWDFLNANVSMTGPFLRFELNRYLGWPGQAPSYKVGQRLWEQTRDAARESAARAGQPFDIKQFHARALGLGSVGLDVLKDALT
ncbi:DUF885 domain-containing protein [Sanguibacter suaedae]|uniref:DUF885 domain-containing protein n=1 Tax=Sanguibacter suaedae TaxID=2795737 RepID=A0A934I4M9_9MICO|nr:DUF885 domain-containing protein [Sanguibacter suaedae]MBI9115143.1 DUF885 domain-containing protein [Sanguibacter suaedae]